MFSFFCFLAYKTTIILIDGKKVKLHIWDTSGQGRFCTIIRYKRGLKSSYQKIFFRYVRFIMCTVILFMMNKTVKKKRIREAYRTGFGFLFILSGSGIKLFRLNNDRDPPDSGVLMTKPSVADPESGIWCPFDPWIRDPQ
jgi:hypothetical protein